jgi:hypothetical protein
MRKFIAKLALTSIVLAGFAGLVDKPIEVQGASIVTVGNPAEDATHVDTYSNFTIIDTNNPVSSSGWLNTFEYYAKNNNSFHFVIVDANKVVKWVSGTVTPSAIGVNTFNSPVYVQAGWNLGVHFISTGTIPFEFEGDPAIYTPNNNGLPVVGSTLTQEGTNGRTYSWNAHSSLFCNDAISDSWPTLGMNRYTYLEGSAAPAGGDGWYRLVPGSGKGVQPYLAPASFDLEDTFGCGGKQLLDIIKGITGAQMTGLYKFGIPQGFIESLAEGDVLLETVNVNTSTVTGANTTEILQTNKKYDFKSSGTWANRSGEKVDTRFTTMDNWITSLEAPAGGYLDELLELQINSNFVDWSDYSTSHQYTAGLLGNGSIANFRVFDGDVLTHTPIASWYGDNVGILQVKVYQLLY